MTDPYVDENGVLKNKLHIKTESELKQKEADIGFLKLINVDSVLEGFFDESLLKKIHKHIFGAIYDWAGEYRVVPLYKEEYVLPRYSIPYTDCNEIESDLKRKIKDLNTIAWQSMQSQEIAPLFARKMALLWKTHPFRDGNTRSMLCFSYLYAKEHGFPFDIKTFIEELNRQYDENGNVTKYSIRDKFVLACLDDKDYPEVIHLARTFQRAMENHQEEIIHRAK